MLSIKCKKHPKYLAVRAPSAKCDACYLLYILRWQHERNADEKLGGTNPYQFLGSTDDAAEGLQAQNRELTVKR